MFSRHSKGINLMELNKFDMINFDVERHRNNSNYCSSELFLVLGHSIWSMLFIFITVFDSSIFVLHKLSGPLLSHPFILIPSQIIHPSISSYSSSIISLMSIILASFDIFCLSHWLYCVFVPPGSCELSHHRHSYFHFTEHIIPIILFLQLPPQIQYNSVFHYHWLCYYDYTVCSGVAYLGLVKPICLV